MAPSRRLGEPLEELTDRQREILSFISEHVTEKGYPPSVREIGEAVGLSSPSTVHAHPRPLPDRGYLRTDPPKPRTIEPPPEPRSGAPTQRPPVRHLAPG